jgi:MtN3 and saliva related transmembrane protein
MGKRGVRRAAMPAPHSGGPRSRTGRRAQPAIQLSAKADTARECANRPSAVPSSQRPRLLACRRLATFRLWESTLLSFSVELIGSIAALITTFAWLPQIAKILRERKAADISLVATAALASGVFLWMIYGLFIGSWPVILANGGSFLFIAAIVGLKLRYG